MVGSSGQLSSADLQAHPVHAVVHTQAALESAVTTGVAIWIDKGAAATVDRTWLHAHERAGYPIAVIGTGSEIRAFWFVVHFGGPLGTGPSAQEMAKPGFAVWCVRGIDTKTPSDYVKGFPGTPTVESVSAVTDALLEGREP
jgi:hypothetical protein